MDTTNTTITSGQKRTSDIACWGNNVSVKFNVNVPKSGTYNVYVDASTKVDGNSWKATIGGKTLTGALTVQSGYTPYSRVKYGSVELTAGTQALTMTSVRTSDSVILRRIVFVQEGTKDYKISTEAIDCTTLSGVNKAASSGAGWAALFNQGYISFTVTPEYTGVYDLSWDYAANGLKGITYVNDEQIDERIFTGGNISDINGGVLQSIGEVTLLAGKPYMIRLADDGSGTFGVEKLVLTYQRKATMEDGMFLDAYVGDSVSGYTATKYSDGKDTNPGFGFAGGLYTEFDMTITEEGLYDVALQLGCSDATSVSVYVDNALLETKDNLNYGNYDGRNKESFGKIILRAGTHRVKVLCNSGGMQLFKLRMTSVRAMNDTDPYNRTIPAISYDSKNFTGDSKEQGTAIVLANLNSYAQYDVELPAGNYVFSIRYSRASTAKMGLVVNGEAVGNYSLLGVSDYTKQAVAVLSLKEGVNSIRVVGSGSYYYYTHIYLEKITEPVSELYHGDYISQELSLGENFTSDEITDDLIFRTYLPANMKDQFVRMIGSIYDGEKLVDTVWSEPVKATANSVVITRMSGLELDETKTYSWKVNDYICYSTEDVDETEGINLSGKAYDKTAFGVKLIFEDTNASFGYASGISVSLKENGSLGVVVGGNEVEIAPTKFETFKNQVFELQITTDVADNNANIGIWIDKKLANGTYYVMEADTLDSKIAFSDKGLKTYTLWKIARPDIYSVDYIQLKGTLPYIVEYDSMTFTGDNTVYTAGNEITKTGDYTVNVCGVEYDAILWKGNDLHADGVCDTRDLIAMKKMELKESIPEIRAGLMAASYLESAYELVTFRQTLAAE